MKEIVTGYLKNYTGSLLALYNWSPDEKILADRFGIDISRCDSVLDKNVLLKSELTKIIRNNPSKENKINIANYIIKDWGGIRRFGRAEEVVTRFQEIEFSRNIPDIQFDFQGISSWSKYLSIIAPDWACIYDARVAYSLNVINYISGSKHPIFPGPSGRNSKINLLDIESLLLAAKIQEPGADSPRDIKRKHYISEDEVYKFYIKLIHGVHNELWDTSDPIQYTEMLLFAIADSYAYKDLLNFCARSKNKTSIN